MSLEFTDVISDGEYDLFEITCDDRGVSIREADGSRRISLERDQFDKLLATVMKYDAMRKIAEGVHA